MKYFKGFTLAELLIVIAIIAILAAVAAPMFNKNSNEDGTVCKGGYKFVGITSRSPQILDSNGHGIPCTMK